MIFSDLPNAQLRALLLDLGFDEREIQNRYWGFYHAPSDTLFAFRKYRPTDMVLGVDLASTRSQLDWRGLLSEEAFDASLRKASA